MGDISSNILDEIPESRIQRIVRKGRILWILWIPRILGWMKNPLEALMRHLLINMKNGNGIPLATLLAQFALFTAILFLWETGFYAEYDSRGFKTALSYQISALLVSNSWRLSQFGVIRRSCGFMMNTMANGAWLILAILLEKFYEKSLSSLGFALSIAVSFLILLVIIRPSTDLGFFGFLIGVVGSVAYNLFGLKFRTWIVVAICILLLGFKSWLEKNWLEVKRSVPPPKRFSKSKIIESVTVAGFYLVWDYNLFRTNFQNLNLPDSDSKSGTSISLIAIVSCVVISCVWLALILVPRVYLLFRIVLASLLIQLIPRKDKWWNKFLLKGNDSFDYFLKLALKLSLEHVEDGVALRTYANITQLKRELEAQPRIDGGEIVEILDEYLVVCFLYHTFAGKIIENDQPPRDLTEEGWEERRATKWNILKSWAKSAAEVFNEAYQPPPLEIYTKINDLDEGWKPVTEEIVANPELLFKTDCDWQRGIEVFNGADRRQRLLTNEFQRHGWDHRWREDWKQAYAIKYEADQTAPEFDTDHGWMTITAIIEADQPLKIWYPGDKKVQRKQATEIIKAKQPPWLKVKKGWNTGWLKAFEVDRQQKFIKPENWEKEREKLKAFLN